MRIFFLAYSIILFSLCPVFSEENIRGPLVDILNISSQDDTSPQTSLLLEDLCALFLDKNNRLVNGYELSVSVPQALRPYQDGLILLIYYNVTPAPDKSIKGYTGERLVYYPLPRLTNFYIDIPLAAGPGFKRSIDTFVTQPLASEKYPLMVTILPAMKGIPSSLTDQKIQIKAAPVFKDLGILTLILDNVPPQEIQGITVMIDEKKFSLPVTELTLEPGIHRLKILSQNYKDETINFTIEKGKTNELKATLQIISSSLSIEAPRGSLVYLDSLRLDSSWSQRMPVQPGDHTLLCKVGDYTLTKKFTVEKGKHYKISLLMDLTIQEN